MRVTRRCYARFTFVFHPLHVRVTLSLSGNLVADVRKHNKKLRATSRYRNMALCNLSVYLIVLSLYLSSSVTIDLAGSFTISVFLLIFAPLNSFGHTTSGFSKEL